MQSISSKENKVIKYTRNLLQKKYRDKENAFIVEGIKMANESIGYKENIKYVIISENFENENAMGKEFIKKVETISKPLYQAKDEVFKSVSDMETPQGVIVVMERLNLKPKHSENEMYILLNDVQDPGNVGTILRIADAINATEVIVSAGTADVFSPKVLRATMGAIYRVPVRRVEKLDDILNDLKAQIVVTSLTADKYYYEPHYENRVALIIGNESRGVSKSLQEKANIKIKIPMPGKAESLNASVATGIVAYEILKQKFI